MKNPLKIWARHKVEYAVNRGYLKKLPCLVCGEPKVEAHHSNYLKPLMVIWYCRSHHDLAHGKRITLSKKPNAEFPPKSF